MTYKISKFLIIGLLVSNYSLVRSSEVNSNNNILNKKILDNNIKHNKNYNIQIDISKPLTKVEVEEFFGNIKSSPSALNNLKYQLYSIKNEYFENPIFDTIIELLYEYFKEVAKSKNSNLYDFYNKKLFDHKDDKGIQIIILINEYLNNPTQQIKSSILYNNFWQNIINDASIICNNIITKIIRGVNLSEKLIKSKKNIIKNLPKTMNKNNIITFSNQGKCWFMAYFSFLIAMYDQSNADDPIRNTNFGRFINYLHNKQNEFTRKVDNQRKRIVKREKYKDFDYLNQGKWENHELKIGYNEYFYPSSNVIGERIDLLSELINYWRDNSELIKNSNEKDRKALLYHKNIRNQLDKINNISEVEKERRNKALELIENLQDLYYGSAHTASSALMIILNIFPELEKFIGNGPVKGMIDGDAMIYCAENTELDNEKLKEEHIYSVDYNILSLKDTINRMIQKKNIIEKIQEKTIDKDSNKYKELQIKKDQLENKIKIANCNIKFYKKQKHDNTDFSIANGFTSYWNLGHADVIMDINNGKVFSDKQHLLFEIYSEDISINDLVNGYRYITHYNQNGKLEVYELISILLGNSGHAICFVKNGKSDFSWSGIDSSLGYNDDNYTLDDIVYDDKLVEKNINGQILEDKNTYLSKMYHVKNDGRIYVDQKQFYPVAVLYKKVSEEEIKQIINKSNTITEKFLSDFDSRISFSILCEEQNKQKLIEKFNSDIKDNELIEFCRKTILDQIDTFVFNDNSGEKTRELLNNKEYNLEVNDIIHNNIYYIISEYYKKLHNNTKLDDINFNINDITNNIPQKANYWYQQVPQNWLYFLKRQIKREYVLSNIKNRYRNNYIEKVLMEVLNDDMKECMINDHRYKFEYCILSSIHTTTYNYFDFRKKYNNEIFSIIKSEFEKMNPSWNMENIARICNLIKNGYITNPDIIKYMKEYYNFELEE